MRDAIDAKNMLMNVIIIIRLYLPQKYSALMEQKLHFNNILSSNNKMFIILVIRT